jgi:hypothetical protein
MEAPVRSEVAPEGPSVLAGIVRNKKDDNDVYDAREE